MEETRDVVSKFAAKFNLVKIEQDARIWENGVRINNHTYSGFTLNGRPHGYGECTYADLLVQKGYFKNGLSYGLRF